LKKDSHAILKMSRNIIINKISTFRKIIRGTKILLPKIRKRGQPRKSFRKSFKITPKLNKTINEIYLMYIDLLKTAA
jgi:hypothetical protein